jgi:leucine dehydrogenase
MLFESPFFADHEKVVFCRDRQSDLTAIIAIHSTRLGPAAGGCRMFPYASEQEALADVLQLSRAMTYKNALAGLKLGGGKSVIIADPRAPGAKDRLRAFGERVQAMGGEYWTAEDVGVDLEGVEAIARGTRFVFGTRSGPSATGDPSAYTARGVFAGMRAAVHHRLERDGLAGLTVTVQGVGSVGWQLCRILHEAGARLIVSDRNPEAVRRAERELGVGSVLPELIHTVEAEVFAPCAMGGVVNEATLPALRAKVVAGAANNPVATPADAAELRRRGILYAPDFVINAGGMMHASGEIFGVYDEPAVARAIEGIYATVARICVRADLENTSPDIIAIRMAGERLCDPAWSNERA